MRILSRFITLSLWTSVCLSTTAQAVVLQLPVSPTRLAETDLPGTSLSVRPELAGVTLEDVLTPFHIPISSGGTGINGMVQSRVVREDVTGTLDFYWKVSVTDAEGDLGVASLRFDTLGYGNFQDADWRSDSPGDTAPNVAMVFSPSLVPSGAMNFHFNSPMVAGTQSQLFFLHTDAIAYARTARYDLQSNGYGFNSLGDTTFAPATVPEPSGLVMSMLGLLALGRLARRQHRG